MNKRLFSMFLALCMIVTMLPVTAMAAAELATTVTVGGVTLNADNSYAKTNAAGTVTTEGAGSGDYNVKFDAATGTLTLRNANIKYESITANVIFATGTLTIVAVGTNAVAASGNSAAIYITTGNLTLKGDGALTAVSDQTLAVQASNITVKESITLTAVGGATTAGQPGGDGLYAFNNLEIKGTARVTAVGGKSPISSPFSAGIRAGSSIAIGGSATVTAVGGDTRLDGYSAGISVYNTGAITIGDSAKVVAVGGNADTNASYGLYASDGSGTGSIIYSGGLLVAKGGKGATSLAMNKVATGDELTSAAVTNNDGTSKYCVVNPKTDDTAVYRVVTEGLSTSAHNETAGHIEWSANNLTLANTIVIAPDGTDSANDALNMQGMPENAMLNLEGFNVLLAGDATGTFSVAVEGGGSHSDLTITGSGDLTAISGSGYQCYGILNTKNLSSTGTITSIGGSGYTLSHGISNFFPLSISAGKVIAIGSGSISSYGIYKDPGSSDAHSISGGSGVSVGRNSAINTAPTLTGVATMGAYNSKVMAWGPAPLLPSATPTADTTTVAKTSETQTGVAFALINSPEYADGQTWKVYTDPTGDTLAADVTASLSGSTLTLTHATDLPAGIYYVSVTETGKAESARLALTVGAYVPAPTTYPLTVDLNGGNGGTVGGDYAANASIPINAGTKDGYSFSGWTSSNGGSFDDQSSAATTFTMPANAAVITANWSYNGGGGGGSTLPSTGAPVIVDGKTENIGTESKSGDATTVTVDQSKLGTNIGGAASGSSVVVPVSENGSATASLVVKNIEDMADKGMTLTVQTGGVAYNLNTSAIDTAALTAAFPGVDMSKVPFDVTIANSSVSVEGETLVLSPVAFTVTATYDGKTVDVDTFSAYIDRVIEVTAEQAAKITTAVVVNADGSVRHVPTNVIEKDGKYYAVVSSRTNSTYALIQNEVTFSDAAGKWYEAAVNEMGSRKIIAGRSASAFDGDAGITRAEFAVILVRALGLPADGISTFSDVPADAWYSGAVATAAQYGIVSGKGDNQFDPDANITRQEAMLMLQRASALTEFAGAAGNLDSFADAGSVGTWAQDAAKWSVGSGLIQGSDGKLNPTADITRAESAIIILRLLQKAGLVDVRSEA